MEHGAYIYLFIYLLKNFNLLVIKHIKILLCFIPFRRKYTFIYQTYSYMSYKYFFRGDKRPLISLIILDYMLGKMCLNYTGLCVFYVCGI